MLPARAFLLAVLASGALGGGPAFAESRGAAGPGQIAALAALPAPARDQADDAAAVAPGARGGCDLAPRFPEDVGFQGPITGEPEKDSVGFVLIGHDHAVCPDAPVR